MTDWKAVAHAEHTSLDRSPSLGRTLSLSLSSISSLLPLSPSESKMLSILVTLKVLPHDNTYAHKHARSGLGYEAVHRTRAQKKSPGYASLEKVLEPCRPCDHIAAIDVTCSKIIQMARPTLGHDASSERPHSQQRPVAVCPNRRQHRTRCDNGLAGRN